MHDCEFCRTSVILGEENDLYQRYIVWGKPNTKGEQKITFSVQKALFSTFFVFGWEGGPLFFEWGFA